jgi:hypothetical protein
MAVRQARPGTHPQLPLHVTISPGTAFKAGFFGILGAASAVIGIGGALVLLIWFVAIVIAALFL